MSVYDGACVSPGSRPRPSLSGQRRCGLYVFAHDQCVAGVSAPAFVERLLENVVTVQPANQVSPGSRPRPSLSGLPIPGHRPPRWQVSPGSRAPAFVERGSRPHDPAAHRLCRRGLGPGLR